MPDPEIFNLYAWCKGVLPDAKVEESQGLGDPNVQCVVVQNSENTLYISTCLGHWWIEEEPGGGISGRSQGWSLAAFKAELQYRMRVT